MFMFIYMYIYSLQYTSLQWSTRKFLSTRPNNDFSYFSIHCIRIWRIFHSSQWDFHPSGRWFFSTSEFDTKCLAFGYGVCVKCIQWPAKNICWLDKDWFNEVICILFLKLHYRVIWLKTRTIWSGHNIYFCIITPTFCYDLWTSNCSHH